ncbi:chemotaxis protein CheW [Natrarchaeobius oligotrophus]|uniref:Chemotaxis protein CheW n=1 Tax=Natrarchaeobius chitinivorans TaxID=1679083 RepID=A0A3N6PLG8_NATCH|nr:chemotaxis protein CheW [Natrarchaeobius chitinivorans]RQG99785.1 chemotaxis protein CheW [Natrarchaeobius chitinivorans]
MASFSTRDGRDTESDRLTVLTFSLAGKRYCVRVDAVASVVSVTQTGSLESADDPWNAGSTRVDDEQVRVVDLLRVFEPDRSRVDDPELLVLSETDERGVRYGWLVDEIDVTETVRRTNLEPAKASAQFVEGRFDLGEGGAIWLDEREIHG